MDLGLVMDEIADQLKTIGGGLRVHNHPPDTVAAPAAIVTYPDALQYDKTYARGMDQMDPGIVVLVGKVSSRAARDRIAKYCAGSGPESFKEVLEGGTYSTLDSLRVVSVAFDIIAVSAVEYLAATFTLDISGQGES